MVGPSFSMLRSFFSSVLSIITWTETERHMARAGDVLLDSCGTIGVAVPAGARLQQHMMPRALGIPIGTTWLAP